MTSPRSGSEGGRQRSSAFDRLHPELQRWIWKSGWESLREVQESAIPVVLPGDRDVIIAAATAGGKTEAAFLPILSRTAADETAGFRVLCVSPLKALINDQHRRLEEMAESVRVPVHRWHGDVGHSQRTTALDKPAGVLLITPESLEAMFIRRGTMLRRLFAGLAYVVIDELHVFIGAERGRQLQSLLHRLELVLRRRIPRVALSATLGDLQMASEFLRPGDGDSVTRVVSSEPGGEVRLQIRGYIDPARAQRDDSEEDAESAFRKIVAHNYKTLRGDRNLLFINRKSEVERYADAMRRTAEREKVPNEFFPHHGSLSKALREDVEGMLKDGDHPVTAVCTSTLELGVDIGAVESVAQIGSPPGVASLRQRLGRSGRRDGPATLRIYIDEPQITPRSSVIDPLRLEMIESTAMVELLIAGWCEPPPKNALQLSTLIQQTLSAIAQVGGARAAELWNSLCRSGAFYVIDQPTYAEFLHCLASHDLIIQSADGVLLPGERGERLINHYEFYSAFTTNEEYRIEHGGRVLGSVPISHALIPGQMLIFSGRRWTILQVDEEQKRVTVAPAEGGMPPKYSGGGSLVHGRVRREMFRLYVADDVPAYLDSGARTLLQQGRTAFRNMRLSERRFLQNGKECWVFLWVGDRTADTVLAMLRQRGLSVATHEGALTVFAATERTLVDTFEDIANGPPPDPWDLAASVANKRQAKHDGYLSKSLLCADYASSHLDVPAAMTSVRSVLRGLSPLSSYPDTDG